jgi:hypothetical protein
VGHLGKRQGFDRRMFVRVARVPDRFRPRVMHTPTEAVRFLLAVHLFAGVWPTLAGSAEGDRVRSQHASHTLTHRPGRLPAEIYSEEFIESPVVEPEVLVELLPDGGAQVRVLALVGDICGRLRRPVC